MKQFHFSKTYFHTLLYENKVAKLYIKIKEQPSLEITEESYMLRIETRHEEEKLVHRDYAIEHHLSSEKHQYPHLQFKFHTEEIGTFRIKLYLDNSEEYERAVKGFIYKIKTVLHDLERFKKGITNEILVLELVNQLKEEGSFLSKKIEESLRKQELLIFEDKKISSGQLQNLRKNPLLLGFLGTESIDRIIASYPKKIKK